VEDQGLGDTCGGGDLPGAGPGGTTGGKALLRGLEYGPAGLLAASSFSGAHGISRDDRMAGVPRRDSLRRCGAKLVGLPPRGKQGPAPFPVP